MIIFKEIKLSNGNVVLVDNEDYDWLMQYKWRHDKDGYARTSYYIEGKRFDKRMHRLIMNEPKGIMVDHINGNILDNRKENLRLANNTQNQWNQKPRENTSSKYKGVIKRKHSFEVVINNKYKGHFTNEIAAANCYNYYAKKYFGEFAWLNDVPYMSKEEYMKYKQEKKNTSKFRGVHWCNTYKKWIVKIHINKKKYYIGRFDNEIEAAKEYNKKALKLLGDNAKLNKIPNP